MRRKVRGTVSGIYICSAALGVFLTPSRLHGCSRSCNKTGFSRFLLHKNLMLHKSRT